MTFWLPLHLRYASHTAHGCARVPPPQPFGIGYTCTPRRLPVLLFVRCAPEPLDPPPPAPPLPPGCRTPTLHADYAPRPGSHSTHYGVAATRWPSPPTAPHTLPPPRWTHLWGGLPPTSWAARCVIPLPHPSHWVMTDCTRH